MSRANQTLLEGLRDVFILYGGRETVGSTKTEHSVFIPAELLKNPEVDTKRFILVAKTINNRIEWNCPVTAEETSVVRITGIEFVFHLRANTDFEAIVDYIETRLQES